MSSDAAYVNDILSCLSSSGDDHHTYNNDLTTTTHAQLFTRIRAGDSAAFDELLTDTSRQLEAYARRFTRSKDAAKDVIQDVFAHLWENRTTITIRGSVRGYLYTAVRNRALDIRKRDKSEEARWHAAGEIDHPAGMAHESYLADTDAERREIATRVMSALNTLPPRAREAALLRWTGGLSRQEIAEVMGVALGTVKNHLTLATNTVRALLVDLKDS